MKKTIWAVMAVLVIIMSISCGGNPKTSTEAEILGNRGILQEPIRHSGGKLRSLICGC